MNSLSVDTSEKVDFAAIEAEIQRRYIDNLALFEAEFPEVYETIKNVQLTKFGLLIEDDGSIHLVDGAKKPIYPSDIESFCQKQVDHYYELPQMTDNHYLQMFIRNPNHIYIKYFNRAVQISQKYIDAEVRSKPSVIPLMLHCNVGLGHHLKMLLNKCEINNLIVVERSKELFCVSLFTLNWREIIEYFRQKHRSIHFFVERDVTETILRIRMARESFGMHNIINTFIYSHLQFEDSTNFIGLYARQNHHNLFGMGFFDDEQTGLAHTAVNLEGGHSYFKSCPKFNNKQTAFIIGNGPSLDDEIDFIKKHREKVILFSCGTALSSLFKVGIKPDFHIETERNKHLTDWIQQGTSAEFRKDVTLLCLNTVSPEVIALFDEVCIARKAMDAGEALINAAFEGDKISPLAGCNPTVSNAGVVFALNMGFKTLVLVGVDLGMKPNGYHHSSLSIYKDIEDKAGRKNNCSLEKEKGKYLVKGNFGGQVTTNSTLDNSAQIMANMIGIHRQKHGAVKGYNVNSGAFIPGFDPIKSNDLKFKDNEKKQTSIANIKHQCFVSGQANLEKSRVTLKENIDSTFELRPQLELKLNPNSLVEICAELDRVFHLVKSIKERYPAAHYLLTGSVSQFCSRIMRSCVFQPTEDLRREVYLLVRDEYHRFLDDAYELLDKNPLKLDDTTHDSIAALKRVNSKNGSSGES